VEPGLSELLKDAVQKGKLTATTDASEAIADTDVAILCVGTPTGPDDNLELRALVSAARQIGQALRGTSRAYTVLVRSTVPPGTAEELISHELEAESERRVGSGDSDIMVLTLPEFLREATAIADYDDPPFLVVGGPLPPSTRALALIDSMFGDFDDRTHWVSYRTAELLKNVCNAYHAVKVVFANEVGALCEAADINGIELMRVFCEDRKLNISPAYLRPGLPFGGSCLPKDLRALVSLGRRCGVWVPQLGGASRSNELHIDRAIESVASLGKRRIGLEGLAFKAGTDDVRGSPMVAIAERLLGKGFDIRIYDPLVLHSHAQGEHDDIAHLAKLLVPTADELLLHAEVLVRGRSSNDLLVRASELNVQPLVVDLGRPPYRARSERIRREPTRVAATPADAVRFANP
jgi:GDP-mannose 6-dehydrogenase